MNSSQIILPEKTLFDVLRDLWCAKIYLLFFSCLSVICAFVFLVFAQDYYRAEMIIAPASHMGQGIHTSSYIGEGSIQTQAEDLQSTPEFLRFEHIYDGVSVASILFRDKEILSALQFDRKFEFSTPENGWTVEKLSEYLKTRVILEPISGSPLRKLIYLHPDKKFAAYMISRIHAASDNIIRKHVLRQVNGRIKYLGESLAVTTNPLHRKNLAALLMEQERRKMLASLDQSYAATIIERPFVLSRPNWPDPYVIYPAFLFVGLLLGFIIYGLRHNE